MSNFYKQTQFEQTMLKQGKARFHRQEQKAKEKNQYSRRPSSQILIQKHIEIYAQKIEEFVHNATEGHPGHQPFAARFLNDLESKTVASIASRCIFDLIKHKPSLRRLSAAIGQLVQTEREFQCFFEQAPRSFQIIMQNLTKQNMDTRLKRYVLDRIAREQGLNLKEMEPNEMILTGSKLADLFIEATGLVMIEKVQTKKKHLKAYVMLTPDGATFIEEVNKRLENIKPVWGPIPEKPRPWKGLKEGGFHTLPKSLVRTRSKLHRALLEGCHMPKVLDAINALQETPWRVNKPVLDVAVALRDIGLKIAGLPEKYDPEIHGRPEDWKKESHSKYEEGMKHMMKNFECGRTLGVAQTYRREERFYFVHTLDFRGRAYPVTSYLSPQGKDLDRGLLTFAKECAEPLGESGVYWLTIHGANCWGHNKLTFAERIAWIEEHTPRILRVAEDPLGDYWWTEAEEPFQFLAFCFEWANYQQEGPTYMCSLPVAVDGSSNALQHFSALLLDKELGEATNMLPVERPRDLYQEIADLVKPRIEKDAENGSKEASALLGKLNRKVVKTPVMTAYYGVTQQGMRDQIEEAFEDQNIKIEQGKMKAIMYLVKILTEMIPQKTPAVKPCMGLLQEVTRILAKNNLPTTWTTPSGFLVVQDSRDYPRGQVKTKLFGKVHCINYQKEGMEAKVNVREQVNGISANFIHSLDSSAMMLCVLEAKAQGVKAFRMIHDGFATVPGHMECLNKAIRKSFMEMYEKDNLLQKFVREALEKNRLHNMTMAALEEKKEQEEREQREQEEDKEEDAEKRKAKKKQREKEERQKRKQKEKKARRQEEETWETVWAKFNIQFGELDLSLLLRALYFFA